MILALKTDNPMAELYLLKPDGKLVSSDKWLANQKLADTLLARITQFLETNTLQVKELTGLIVFTGAGSFTGLRIATAVANSLAYSLEIPVTVGQGNSWLKDGMANLAYTPVARPIIPIYSTPPNITSPD